MPEGKIKLLHLHAPLHFGGGEVFLSNFYEASAPWFENRTILFSRSDAFTAALNRLGNVTYSQFYDRDLKVGSMKKYSLVMAYAIVHMFEFKKIVRKYADSDFVIGHGFPFTVVIPVFKLLGILPSGMRTVHFQHHRLRRPEAGPFWRWLYGILLASFDLIVVDAIPVRDDILRPLPELKDKIFIIGTGLPFEKARRAATQAPDADVVRVVAAQQGHRTIAIYASRYVPHKNHQIFLKILQRLRAEGAEKRFLLALTGHEIIGSDFEKQVGEQGFKDSVVFTGALGHDDVFRTMKLADICLFPSLEEGFGLSILEALALGIPTLIFRDAIPQELHPFLMLADSEEDFINRAVEMIRQPAILEKEKEALKRKEKDVEYFDIEQVLARFHKRLQIMLS